MFSSAADWRVKHGVLFVSVCLLMAVCSYMPPVQARSIKHYAAQDAVQPITIHQAVKRVKQREKGKVLGAQTNNIDGRSVHVIKIVTEKGRVKHIQVDAQTGAIKRP